MRRAVELAVDWRKCWLGATGVAVWLVGVEVIVAGTTLGGLHAPDLVWLGRLASDDGHVRGACVAWAGLALVWGLVCTSRFGCAIARLGAFELATGRRASLAQGWRYARDHRRSLVWAPVGFALACAILLVPACAAGYLGSTSSAWGPVAAAIGVLPALVASALAVALAGAALVGWPLMVGAVAVDESDAFDAASRSLAYLGSKPALAAQLRAASLGLGAVVLALVLSVAAGAWIVTDSILSRAMGPDRHAAQTELARAIVVGEWRAARPTAAGVLHATSLALAACGVLGIAASYVGSSAVIQYLVLRHEVDGTPLLDVELGDDERALPGGELVYDPLLLDFATEPGEAALEDRRVANAHP